MTSNRNSAKPPPDEAPQESGELMYVKCAGCGKWMDVKPGHLNSISHSLCPACYAQEIRKLEQGATDRGGA